MSRGWLALSGLSLAVALYAAAIATVVPLGATVHPEMRANFETHRTGILAHIFGGVVALALGPFQMWTGLRQRRPRLHRWLGRIYLGPGILVGGLAGLHMARYAYGGGLARAGFAALALAWLLTGSLALTAIRRGRVAVHRRWMARNFALTFAAVTLRLYLPLALAAGIAFETAYPIIAWLCWVPNLAVVELWRRR